MRQVKDLLNSRVAHTFVGRTEELALLLQTVEPDGPLVVHLHGIAGSASPPSSMCSRSARARLERRLFDSIAGTSNRRKRVLSPNW